MLVRYAILTSVGLSLLIVSAGCGTAARRIDPTGTATITTVEGLDIQDATDAAAELSESLLAASVLGRDGKPSIIAIDRYVNDTSQQIDRDVVVKKIRVSLNKAGVAQTMTTMDSTGGMGGESNIATRAAQERHNEARTNAFLNDAAAPELPKPDYALTFKILDNRVRAGRTRQTTYTFQMSLTDVKTGLAVWEDEKQITKQGSKPAVGW